MRRWLAMVLLWLYARGWLTAAGYARWVRRLSPALDVRRVLAEAHVRLLVAADSLHSRAPDRARQIRATAERCRSTLEVLRWW